LNPKKDQDATPHPPRHPGADPDVSVYAASDTDLLLKGNKFVVVGYNHRTASLDVRSRFAVPGKDIARLSRRFVELPGISGCVILATCNRLEAYLAIRSEAEAEAAFVELVGGQDVAGRAVLARSLFVRVNEKAIQHLFRVVSGLDAMVLGDAQILGQSKTAYREACSFGTGSPMLHKVFHAAFRCAKTVRTRTDLDGAHSVAGSGMALLAERIGSLRGKRFLLVGVNEMTETAAERLVKARADTILIANRTAKHGAKFLATLEANGTSVEQVPWDRLLATIAMVDAVITSTGASDPVFRRRDLATATAGRAQPLTVLDLAVPPDVEPMSPENVGARADETFRVLDLEDVGAYQQDIEKRRCQAAAAGERLVLAKVDEFARWLHNQTLAPKMERLRVAAEAAMTKELVRQSRGLSCEQRTLLQQFGETLVKRFLGAYRRVDDQD